MKIALYLRVSTKRQTVENQRISLHEWAERAGHEIVAEFADEGVSASRKRKARRPQFEKMLKAATRREFDQLAVWSLDRLGRSMKETVNAITDLDALGISIYMHRQGVDTSTPHGKAFAYMAGIFAEAESDWLSDRIHAGLETARLKNVRLGRPPASDTEEGSRCDKLIREMLRDGQPIRLIKERLRVGSDRVYKVKNGIAA